MRELELMEELNSLRDVKERTRRLQEERLKEENNNTRTKRSRRLEFIIIIIFLPSAEGREGIGRGTEGKKTEGGEKKRRLKRRE